MPMKGFYYDSTILTVIDGSGYYRAVDSQFGNSSSELSLIYIRSSSSMILATSRCTVI